MPNKHAAIKDLTKNRKRAVRNSRNKIHIKALERKFSDLVKEGKKKEALEMVQKLQQAVAKAGKNQVFHPNKSARKISHAHKMLAALK